MGRNSGGGGRGGSGGGGGSALSAANTTKAGLTNQARGIMASDSTVKKGGAAAQVTDKLSLDQIEQYFKNEMPNWKRGPVQIARVRSGEESISSLRADLANRIAYDM